MPTFVDRQVAGIHVWMAGGAYLSAAKKADDKINAAPTKAFFVDMLTKDIPLEQAVLDLVDNSVDGAKRLDATTFEGRRVDITFNKDHFRILDNCGGFDRETAKDYAFRFGRPEGTPVTPHSVGQFGVGMKRALFKFGNHFVVRSATDDDKWAIDVDVKEWEDDEDDWHFDWKAFGKSGEVSEKNPGTDIVVDELRSEVSTRFATAQFENAIIGLIKSKHRQFVAKGLNISVNEKHVDATDLFLLTEGALQPGVDNLVFGSGTKSVRARIVVAVGASSPREAGWYVVCNGRVILEADRRDRTGWGLIEYDEDVDRVVIPSYHNQFARFRGIVSFESRDSSQLPWNTTKTDVDDGHPVWQKTFQRMAEMMRPVIKFLNDLDKDIDEFTREGSALYEFVTKASKSRADDFTKKSDFKAPRRDSMKKQVPTVKIQYSRPTKDVDFLQKELSLSSAKSVGEWTFDAILKRHKGK